LEEGDAVAGTDERHVTGRPFGVRAPRPLGDATHVGAVHLQIADLSRSLDYYTTVLGMSVLDRTQTVAWLGADGSRLPLVIVHEKRGVAPAPRRGRFGLYHFAVLLPDRAALGRFAAHLLRGGVRPGMADHAVSEALYLTDPDGLGIEVYADRPRSTWSARDGELVMVTEPLDISGLMAAGQDGEWTGMPVGTTMGHVHLHVGDLAEAEAFYHRALGLDKTVWGYPGALFLSAGGYHHQLGVNIWSPGPAASEREAMLLEWQLVVPDGGSAYVGQGLTAAGYGATTTSESTRTADPWGTRLQVIGESAYRQGQV
jgi:catechol 2,3-dioxygenase